MVHGRKKAVRLLFLALLPWLLTAVLPSYQSFAGQSQAEYEFGQFIHFSLSVQADEPISAVTLFYRAAEMPAAFSVSIPVEPALEITAGHTDELEQFQPAPFTTISYWWQVTGTAGTIFDFPAQTLAYDDNRFDWQQLAGENILIRWTREEAALGQLALDIVNDSLPRLTAVIPVSLPGPLRIYVYPSAADLQSSLRLAGREWVGGHASPELGVILVTAANARTGAVELRQSIPHELAHLMLHQAVDPAYESLPRWFDEGFAAIMEADPDPNRRLILDEALAGGTTIPFSQLCDAFPLDSRQAVLAYAQSASFMRYIQTDYGTSTLNQMVLALADGADCESVVSRVFGFSLGRLNQRWLQSFNTQPSIFAFFQDSGIWLLLLSAGFVLMFFFLWPVKKINS